jgi:hypothetical protein
VKAEENYEKSIFFRYSKILDGILNLDKAVNSLKPLFELFY